MAAPTKRIKRTSLVDLVSDQIKVYIKENGLKAGDKLPTEAEFTAMFDVNRFTIRMALQKLSALGIIETRVGEGSFVRDFSFVPVLAELSDAYISEANMEEIFVLRKMIEMECLRLVINNATDEEIGIIRKYFEQYLNETIYDQIAPVDMTVSLEADLNFHRAICYHSKNKLLFDLFLLICPLMKKHILNVYASRQKSGKVVTKESDPHADIVKALEARDWSACKRAYLKSISDDMETIESEMT